MPNFSKSVTMNQETTCDIPFERYCQGYAINHTKRNGGGHRLNFKCAHSNESYKTVLSCGAVQGGSNFSLRRNKQLSNNEHST